MIQKKAQCTDPWSPAGMKREFDALVHEIENRLYATHFNLVQSAGGGAVVGDVARLHKAVNDRQQAQGELRRLWTEMERAHQQASFALNELMRRLPRDERTRQPVMALIPRMLVAEAPPQAPTTRNTTVLGPPRGILNVDQQLRGLAHEVENKLDVFKGAVARYRDYRTRAQARIRWALHVEMGLTDDAIARLEAEDAAHDEAEAQPVAAEPEVETITVEEQADGAHA